MDNEERNLYLTIIICLILIMGVMIAVHANAQGFDDMDILNAPYVYENPTVPYPVPNVYPGSHPQADHRPSVPAGIDPETWIGLGLSEQQSPMMMAPIPSPHTQHPIICMQVNNSLYCQ